MSKDQPNRAIKEFLSEAQDITEGFGRDLMEIDSSLKTGEPDPDVVNNLFRLMHTLKSLSGMFGVQPLAELAHHEENLLEDVRLGRVEIDAELLDLLFESLEIITTILSAVGETKDAAAANGIPQVRAFVANLTSRGTEPPEVGSADEENPKEKAARLFGTEVLEVLTEYEEHRLIVNLERGNALRKLRMRFDLSAIDTSLEDVRTRLKPVGEIITYLPSTDDMDADTLAIDVIFALKQGDEDMVAALEGIPVEVQRIESESPAPPQEPDSLFPEPPNEERPVSELAPPPTENAAPIKSKPAPLAEAPERALSMRSVSQTVRVDIRKLDRLMNVVGELALVRSAISRISDELRALIGRGDLSIELHKINRGFDRRLADLRDGILEVRMVPLASMFDRLSRMVRKISRSLEKEIHFVVSGADTEVDKLIIEELSDPLMHIVRNAIDHGVESAEDRREAGKPDFGTVALTAYQKGNHVVIEIEDDGAGIDGERLVEVAAERGLVSPEQADALTSEEVVNLIFMPGISTAASTTEISGRGVGMDVVKTNIAALGGVVEVQSEPGIGTKFSVTLPVTLAIIPALLVEVEDAPYAIPLNAVSEALFVPTCEFENLLETATMTLRNETLPLCDLAEFFDGARKDERPDESCVVIATLGQRRLGFIVDHLIEQQDVVIKSLGSSLDVSGCFAGATDIGDERLALVLDPAAVIEEFFKSSDGFDTSPRLGAAR